MSVTDDYNNARLVMEENERREKIMADASDTRQAPLQANKYSVASDRDDCQPSPGSVLTILKSIEKRNNAIVNNSSGVGAGDFIDATSNNTPTLPIHRTKLKSFEESRFTQYAASVYSKASSSSVGTSTEEDRLLPHPFVDKMRKKNDGSNEGPNDHELTNFNLASNGWKPPRGFDGLPTRDELPISVDVAIDNDLTDGAKTGGGGDFSKGKKFDGSSQMSSGANNNKEAERDEEKSCLVDCLYYTLQCCDCCIM